MRTRTMLLRLAIVLVLPLVVTGSFVTTSAARAQNLEPPVGIESQPPSIPTTNALGVQFLHVATAANSTSNYTDISHPLTNGKPNAIVFVTPNWDPGGVGGTYDNHPVGVAYHGLASKWAILSQDGVSAIPTNAAFNVFVPPAGPNVFVHTATVANTGGNTTTIDNVVTNNNPNAIILVTPNWNPGGVGGTYDNHPIGVWYDNDTGKWAVFNQDLVAMPVNAAFNVFVLPSSSGFVHVATVANSAGDYSNIDNALTNNNPNAMVYVTPNWNPGGVGGTYNSHTIGVWYDNGSGKWAIFNQDVVSAIPVNAAFNVLVLPPASATFVHKATAGNSAGDYTSIDNSLSNGNPNAIVFVTPNLTPGGMATYSNHSIGMYYSGANRWSIFNEDGVSAIPVNSGFDVLIPNPDTSVFVHMATAANSTSNYTDIDYPLTNSKPNAIVFVTPNWNPGGVGGTYDNHPVGVAYHGLASKWAILSQDGVSAIPVNAAFNVFVPPAGPNVFVHTATGANSVGNYTIINNVVTNNNPNAIILVTPNWNPGGVGGTYDNHPIGVWYDSATGRWVIFNEDRVSAIPVNAAFNVFVSTNRLYLPMVLR